MLRNQSVLTGLIRSTVAACATLALVAPASAAISIVNDNFISGGRDYPAAPVYSEMGVDANLNGAIESAWYRGGSGTLTVSNPNPGVTPGTLVGTVESTSASWSTYFTPEAAKVNLLNAGDFVRVTWQFSMQNINASNTSQGFRLALVNSPVGTRLTDENVLGTPPSGAYTGYALFLNIGQTTGRSTPFQLLERTAASGDLLGTSGNWGNAVNAPGFGNGAAGYTNGATYTLVWELTRTVANELSVVATMTGAGLNGTGSVSVSTVDASPSSFTYDLLGLRPGSASLSAERLNTPLLKVEVTPDPAGLGLLAIGGIALLRRRHA